MKKRLLKWLLRGFLWATLALLGVFIVVWVVTVLICFYDYRC